MEWMLVPLLALLLLQKADPQADGLKALDEQRYADAAAIFSKAIAADASDYTAHFNLALADTFLKKDSEAIAEYKKVLELKPGVYQAQLNLGQVLLRNKQAAEALPYLEAAAKQKPAEFRPQFYAGEAAFAAGEAGKAEEYYSAAARLNPKSAAAELGLAHAAAKQGRIADAEPHFRKAAELDPSFKDALLELASLLEANKQPAKAIEIYREFPENPAARERMGALLLESGEAERAIEQLETAVKESPTAANRYALAMAYVRHKELAKAEPLLQKAAEEDLTNLELRMAYARVLRDQRKFGPAAQQFAIVAKAKPDSVDAWSELAGMLYLLHRDADTLNALDRVKQLGAEKPGHIFLRAITLDRDQQYKPALEAYERFLAADNGASPDDEFKARQRARILQRELSNGKR